MLPRDIYTCRQRYQDFPAVWFLAEPWLCPATTWPWFIVPAAALQSEPVTAKLYFQVPKPLPVTDKPAIVRFPALTQAGALYTRELYTPYQFCQHGQPCELWTDMVLTFAETPICWMTPDICPCGFFPHPLNGTKVVAPLLSVKLPWRTPALSWAYRSAPFKGTLVVPELSTSWFACPALIGPPLAVFTTMPWFIEARLFGLSWREARMYALFPTCELPCLASAGAGTFCFANDRVSISWIGQNEIDG